ncbi:MAG: YoaP domain-containing protein [Alphaproteobacteria bacterium]|nr:YoaP domain-containing protein [Alphaproteobacteria bacterium]
MGFITLDPQSIAGSHICCAISDTKCTAGYAAKKAWLTDQHALGFRFHRLDERGKVFVEYGPGEFAFMPVRAPDWLVLGCFWVSGRFKGEGNGKALLAHVLDEAHAQGRAGVVSVVGRKKMHFMSDGAWLRRQGFREVDAIDSGFVLLARELDAGAGAMPARFADSARNPPGNMAKGVTVYYSARCPFTDYYVGQMLPEACRNRGLELTVHKLESLSDAQAAPSPATVFSLFLDGRFVTTDLSACIDTRFDKVVGKALV